MKWIRKTSPDRRTRRRLQPAVPHRRRRRARHSATPAAPPSEAQDAPSQPEPDFIPATAALPLLESGPALGSAPASQPEPEPNGQEQSVESAETASPAPPGDGPVPIRQHPGQVEQIIQTLDKTTGARAVETSYVTQEEFDRLLDLVTQLTEVQARPDEPWRGNPRLDELEHKVEEVIQQLRHNRNSGPGS